MCENIRDYLGRLKRELSGSDPATMQDALSDAEEHLSAAVAGIERAKNGKASPEQLASIIEEYGSPSEVASEYRIIERRMKPTLVPPVRYNKQFSVSSFFSVIYDPRTWGALIYMLMSLGTGILYFTWVVVGLNLSISFMILIIGFPMAWLFLKSIGGIIFIEGRLVESLLGIQMPRLPVFSKKNLKWIDHLKLLVKSKQTWMIITYMGMMLPVGVIHFSFVVILISLSLWFMLTPLIQHYLDLSTTMLDGRYIYFSDYLFPLFMIVGGAIFLGTLHTIRSIGRLHGKLAKAMLVGK